MKDSPAFPSQDISHVVADGSSVPRPVYINYPGMTLRDYFAAQAMQGLLASNVESKEWMESGQAAEMSYEYADAMMDQREEL